MITVLVTGTPPVNVLTGIYRFAPLPQVGDPVSICLAKYEWLEVARGFVSAVNQQASTYDVTVKETL